MHAYALALLNEPSIQALRESDRGCGSGPGGAVSTHHYADGGECVSRQLDWRGVVAGPPLVATYLESEGSQDARLIAIAMMFKSGAGRRLLFC